MIKALESLDQKIAAGLLARAALSVAYASKSLDDELVRKIIEEARNRLRLSEEANDPESLERIASLLDEESDKLLPEPNTTSALFRLAERGDLPSDLYEINIIPNVADVYRKHFFLEKDIIETTIRAPTLEQHYGPARKPQEPVMVSLFLRSFRTRWPLKDFSVIVVAQRSGFKLDVHQAWRIYPSKVKLDGVRMPVDWLRRFADSYGYEIELGGKTGNFFLLADAPIPNNVVLRPKVEPRRVEATTITYLTQADPNTQKTEAAFVIAIDILKYRQTLDQFAVKREDIFERFVPPPQPKD
jgi:hypothetical protein